MFDVLWKAPNGLHNREGVGMDIYSMLFVHLDMLVKSFYVCDELHCEMLH